MIKREFLIGFIVGSSLLLLAYFFHQMADVSSDNTKKSERIRLAKIEVCKTITDEAIRALCVVEAGRGDYQ